MRKARCISRADQRPPRWRRHQHGGHVYKQGDFLYKTLGESPRDGASDRGDGIGEADTGTVR
jgi:hypothetical protein